MNNTIAVIHAGPMAPELKRLLGTLDAVGARENYFMTDLIGMLRYEEDFVLELNNLQTEILYGEYFRYCLDHGSTEEFKQQTSRFLEDTAALSTRVAKYLHTTLINQGRYDKDGKFPYEFYAFDGRIISLRSL